MKACNRKILELFYNAKHTGRISKPDAIGRIGEDDEGLVIELTWRVIGGIIADAKFRAFANPNAIAITSLMVDNMIGKSVEDALTMGESVIIDNLGEFLPEYLEVYDMVREAIHVAYENYSKRQSRAVEQFDYDEYIATHSIEEGEEIDVLQIQRELKLASSSKRGRPRKEIDPSAVVEVGEKRGRGRPRKIVDETEVIEEGEKRGRGRPRKVVDESEEQVETVKRGRGRPRKEVDASQVVEVGEKRGRGRPRKVVDESEEQIETIKRGRGRPRKEIDPNAVVEVGEKRGRGRPRKIVDETEIVEIGEKRGRGRPRKVVEESEEQVETVKRGRGRPPKEIDPNQVVEEGEKRGRGRPKKEIKYNFPTDLDEVIDDEEIEQLITGESSHIVESKPEEIVEEDESKVIAEENVNKVEEDDDLFDSDYDLFKSNIRNILHGKEVSNQTYGQIATKKDDDSQPRYVKHYRQQAIITETSKTDEEKVEAVETDDTKRGRGRPKKIVIEEVEDEHEKRGRGRPAKPVNSLTRSLSPAGMANRSNQDIVFASKNVTTTNININVTKTSTSVEDNKAVSDDYSHSATITQQKVEVSLPNSRLDEDDEIEIEPVKLNTTNTFADFEDDDDMEEIEDSHIKDEAPAGGLEDLLKALLDD